MDFHRFLQDKKALYVEQGLLSEEFDITTIKLDILKKLDIRSKKIEYAKEQNEIYSYLEHMNHGPSTKQLFVKQYLNRLPLTIAIRVNDDYTIKEMKYLIAQRMNVSTRFIRLIYAGKSLDENKTLGTYNIDNESTIEAMCKFFVEPFNIHSLDEKQFMKLNH